MLGAIPQITRAKTVAKKGADKYKSLAKSQKQAVNIGGVITGIGILFMGYKLVSSVSGAFDFITGKTAQKEREKIAGKVEQNYGAKLKQMSEKPTITKEKASLLSSRLLEAFLNHGGIEIDRIFDSGTDEDMIWEALSHLKNQADWALVSIIYGAPRGRSLLNELGFELNNSEMKKVRSILSKINVNI